ncbi:MAG: GAF domain-containing protein [Bradymonadia bacterium]
MARGREHTLGHWAFLVEGAAFMGIMVILNLSFVSESPGFAGWSPHPYLLVILLITGRYGFTSGVLVGALASAIYFTQLVVGVDVVSWRDFLSLEYGQPVMMIMALACVLGIIIDHHRQQLSTAQAALAEAEHRLEALTSDHASLRAANVALADRVVGADATVPILYRYARLLNSTQPEEIYRGVLTILAEAFRAERAALYTLVDGQPEKLVGTGSDRPPLWSHLARALTQGGMVTVEDLPGHGEGTPPLYLAGSLREGLDGPVVGVLIVEQMPFMKYNRAAIRLFQSLLEWVSNSLGNAAQLQQLPIGARTAFIEAAHQQGRKMAERLRREGELTLENIFESCDLSGGVTSEVSANMSDVVDILEHDVPRGGHTQPDLAPLQHTTGARFGERS